MSFVVSCQCGKQFRVKDEQAGKKAKCPGCGTSLLLQPPPPEPAAAAEESDPFDNFDLEAAAAMEQSAAVDENQPARMTAAPTPPPILAPGAGGRPMPQALGYATPAPTGRADLREIAVRQKALNYCALAYLSMFAVHFFVPPEVRFVVALIALASVVTGAVFVFMLAIALYGTATGVVLGILSLIPCLINLIVLLVVSNKATGVLRQHGIQVGFLGADSSQIPGPGQFRR